MDFFMVSVFTLLMITLMKHKAIRRKGGPRGVNKTISWGDLDFLQHRLFKLY
jgi:hypothetical protein